MLCVTIKDGCVYHQIYRGNQSSDDMYRMISDALTVLQTEVRTDAERQDRRKEGELV